MTKEWEHFAFCNDLLSLCVLAHKMTLLINSKMKMLKLIAIIFAGISAVSAVAIPLGVKAQAACFASSKLVPGCDCNYKYIPGQGMVLICCC